MAFGFMVFISKPLVKRSCNFGRREGIDPSNIQIGGDTPSLGRSQASNFAFAHTLAGSVSGHLIFSH